MRSALSSAVGGEPVGTVTVGAFPAVPAADWSPAGMGPIAAAVPAVGAVVDVADEPMPELDVDEVVADPEVFDGEELQAARPSAPAAPITSARAQVRGVGEDMRRDGSRSPREDSGRSPARRARVGSKKL